MNAKFLNRQLHTEPLKVQGDSQDMTAATPNPKATS